MYLPVALASTLFWLFGLNSCADVKVYVPLGDIELPIDIVFEATGVPWVGEEVADACIEAQKHILMLNVETDVTIGMYLANKANKNNVVYSVANGDEPVACKELYDLSVDLGFEIVCVG